MRTPDEERDRLERGIPPDWACAWGEDEHGVYASFAVGAVEQRMRWIERGRFWMGSDDEVGRHDREGPRHEVELTAGYWLAETPCTQELWQVVMGDNPSHFQSPRRPVERVSWDDVQEFLKRLGARVEGLAPGLPTEAQWEFACRAGTETATYAGDLTNEVRDDVLDAIAWYGGNSGSKTHDVGLKQPNPWGLHDMLGNVREWCADGPRDYQARLERDPVGPPGPGRVRRGGGWGCNARHVRAAYRLWILPGYRRDGLGFRLARGQGLRPAEPSSQPSKGESKGGDRPASPGDTPAR